MENVLPLTFYSLILEKSLYYKRYFTIKRRNGIMVLRHSQSRIRKAETYENKYRIEKGWFVGHIQEYPDYESQGKTLEDY
jgi:hypothetical protein